MIKSKVFFLKPYYDHPENWLDPFKEFFIASNIDFAANGGMAALSYRLHPRHTVDLDFVINKLGNLPDKFDERGFTYRVPNEPGTSKPYLAQGQTIGGRHFNIDVAYDDYRTRDVKNYRGVPIKYRDEQW